MIEILPCILILSLPFLFVGMLRENKKLGERARIRQLHDAERISRLRKKAQDGDLVAYEEWKELTGKNKPFWFIFWW